MKKTIKILLISFISIILTCMYVLFQIKVVGKPTIKPKGEYMVYYKGHIYDKINNWTPTGNMSMNDKAWFGYSGSLSEAGKETGNEDIQLYDNDPQFIFFTGTSEFSGPNDGVFHKREDILPNPYDEHAEIVLIIDKKADIEIEEELLNEFKQFIEKCLANSSTISRARGMDSSIGNIRVFYKGYPAYQHFGYLGISGDKMIMLPATSSDKYVYYVLPESLSDQIKELI